MACLAQAPTTRVDAIPDSSADAIARAGTSAALAAADSATRLKMGKAYGRAPLSFEANAGQIDDARVKFLSRGHGYNLFLTSTGATFAFFKIDKLNAGPSNNKNPRPLREPIYSQSRSDHKRAAAVLRISLPGADRAARVKGVEEMPGKSNYFIGDDPKKWRTNVPTYSRVKYESIYPGVDLAFYGNPRQLEYDFTVAPGASFKPVRISFDGARRIRLDDSGDLLIETPVGEIRQRKPIIYQETGGAKQPIDGGYVIRGEREVGFEFGDYDTSRTLVIDPVFVYSTSIGGLYNDNANAVAVDAAGNAYVTGMTTSTDFPTVNPFQPNLKIGVTIGIPSDAFVTKLNTSGTTVLYSTYLGGGRSDTANAIAVDDAGNAYLTGYTVSDDFPTTPGAFQTTPSNGGDAFVTKLNPTGNTLVYSTRLGGPPNGPPNSISLGLPTSAGLGIAVDTESSAYITGYTFSPSFPLKRAAQGEFNRGNPFGFQCLHNVLPPFNLSQDAFVTKLNSSGDGLVYSTYLGGPGQDEAFAIAIDSAGSAYVAGRSCSSGFKSIGPGGAADAFLVKLSPTGREFDYEIALGGTGNDAANGVAVDSAGNVYVAGQTESSEFPTTQGAFLRNLGGSVCYVTANGGVSWQAAAGLPNSPVNVLAIDPTNPQKIYAGLNNGLFGSTDGGTIWRKIVLPTTFVTAIAIDPKTPSTIYANSFKSTDGGANWTVMRLPAPGFGCGTARLIIDPSNTATVYLLSPLSVCGDVAIPGGLFKTTDGGNTWSTLRNGANPFEANSLAIDPGNASTLYATTERNLFKSTDGGNTWRVPYEGNRSLVLLAIDPINPSTLYLRDIPSNINNLFKSTDGGSTFKVMGLTGVPIKGLIVDQTNSSTLYAAIGNLGNGGGVLKSTDGGQTWNATDLIGMTINALAIDPLDSSRIYAGAYFDTDGFIAKINAAGSALVYSTYLGTRTPDSAAGIGIDEVGNAYMTGNTFSDRFPTKAALQPQKPGGLFDTATFATELNISGSAILFSSYVGGNEPSFGSGIAVDAAGKVCLAGTTGTFQPIPVANSGESVHGGFDAFVIKIVSPPRVAGASVSGKNLIVTGEGFDRGAMILVDGVEKRTRNDESKPATILIGKKAAKSVAPGLRVIIRVRNADGLLSDSFAFTR